MQGKEANLKVQKTKDLNIRDARLDGLNATFFVPCLIQLGPRWRGKTTNILEAAFRRNTRHHFYGRLALQRVIFVALIN